jgi:hypothetical protein
MNGHLKIAVQTSAKICQFFESCTKLKNTTPKITKKQNPKKKTPEIIKTHKQTNKKECNKDKNPQI